MSMFFFSAEKTTNHVSSLEKQFYNLQIICNLPDVQLGTLRPTSNRYDTIRPYCPLFSICARTFKT